MKKTAVVYWSSTGNTEAMAQAVLEGMKEAGAEAVLLTPDAVDVGALVDVLPDLLAARRAADALHDLRRIFPDDRAYPFPAALSVVDVDIILAIKQAGILQNTKPLFFCGRSFLYWHGFKCSDFPLDFFFRDKVAALEHP